MKHTPERYPKGWGHEDWIVNSEKYCGKLLHLKAGKKSSWHYHKLKEETFFLQSGKATIYYSNDDDLDTAESTELHPGECFHLPIGLRHRIEAIEDTDLFEFSTQHFEEDSHRIIPGD